MVESSLMVLLRVNILLADEIPGFIGARLNEKDGYFLI
jgi:hypothetical protein